MYFLDGSRNLIFVLVGIEIILLSIGLSFCFLSYIFDDSLGSFITLIILPIAGAESAIGLSLLINWSSR